MSTVSITANEREGLRTLYQSYCSDPEFCVMTFREIANCGALPRQRVRRTVRALARKGLAEYVWRSTSGDVGPSTARQQAAATGSRLPARS